MHYNEIVKIQTEKNNFECSKRQWILQGNSHSYQKSFDITLQIIKEWSHRCETHRCEVKVVRQKCYQLRGLNFVDYLTQLARVSRNCFHPVVMSNWYRESSSPLYVVPSLGKQSWIIWERYGKQQPLSSMVCSSRQPSVLS